MFQFMLMEDYQLRKICRDDFDWGYISTARVNDGTHPIETAVQHEKYKKMVIVEAYDTEEEAKAGHEKWVSVMTAEELPAKLIDCSNSEIAQLVDALGGNGDQLREDLN